MTITQDVATNTTYQFRPRGLGLSCDLCFVCGEAPLGDGKGEGSCHENLAAFVASREDGQMIAEIFADFGCRAQLDYRPYEPGWIQVKLGACRTHQPSLRLLNLLTETSCMIDRATIEYCLPRPRVSRDRR